MCAFRRMRRRGKGFLASVVRWNWRRACVSHPALFLPEVQQMLTLPRLRARARSETLERMKRQTFPLAALALALPLAAQAQAFRCTDATGGVLYTDQPCAGGDLVV
ncbi:MAG: DUF4124 domain-containing protein, partial [Ottowia sp.]|nr:DUF4124 domain-containing protein [Ottowia sp.]